MFPREYEAQRKVAIENEILTEIRQSLQNPEGMTESSYQELRLSERRTLLSIAALGQTVSQPDFA